MREARKIADYLLRHRLIACANLIGPVKSYFRWKGKIDRAEEVLIIAKTSKRMFRILEKKIRVLHSYEVPEIIAFDIACGNQDYLRWIDESVKS
jgi:periplasmic divalent cation tolerance protein